MKRGFIPPDTNTVELISLIESMQKAGVLIENITINQSFGEFMEQVEDGNSIIIISYTDIVGSLTELFSKVIELHKRGIIIHSLQEEHLQLSDDRIYFLEMLHNLGRCISQTTTKKGLKRARAEGKTLGRPLGSTKINMNALSAIQLRKNSKVTVAKACETAGCQPRTYYRYAKKVTR